MKITVRYFASIREAAGTSSEALESASPSGSIASASPSARAA